MLGNTIFFICSAWFLLKSSQYSKKKWFYMLSEIWIISIIILGITYIIYAGDISMKLCIKSIFPTLFANNWYMTCYLLFYPIHPLLNIVIRKMKKTELFRISLTMFIMYSCLDFIKSDLFFPSIIILWIAIYFLIAYMQLYMKEFSNDKKKNIIMLVIGSTGVILIAALTNILGLHISYMHDKMLKWATNCNPFLIVISIASFNIVRNIHFKNKIVNYISSLSLLIYIIHENLILRTYSRPYIVNCMYVTFGYKHIVIETLILSVLVFLFGLVASLLYDVLISRLVQLLSEKLYVKIRYMYIYMEKMLMEKLK